MKESIFSFFNAPITNQVPNGVVCVSQLYAYITTSEWLRERTDQVRAASSDEKRFRRLKQSLLPYVTPAGSHSLARLSGFTTYFVKIPPISFSSCSL